MSFQDQVVLITGATGEFGPNVAKAFAAEGARLALTGRKAEAAAELAKEIGLGDERALAVAADVTNAESVAALVKAVIDKWGRVDVLVNVAGGYKPGKPVHEMEDADFDFMLNLNGRSVFNTCRAVIPHMLAQKSGKIVNIGAKAALQAGRKSLGYAAAKSIVLRLTEALSAEVRDSGINVNAVIPSFIDTEANRKANPDADYAKWVAPEKLAAVILFLASDDASAINGAAIPVYGRTG
ncbi:MAG: SDR family oxidoreductase [Chloroflexi bacterium]|nr:SDR family oxidoreductase [Chloroflexota bacterium]